MNYEAMRRYSYPWYIKLFCIGVICLYIYETRMFFVFEFEQHCTLKRLLGEAESYFMKKEYIQASDLYKKILREYRRCSLARNRVIQSSFAMIEHNPELFEYGMKLLKNRTITNKDINEFASYLPTEQYQEQFKSLFVVRSKA